ncbi:hypothetical protein [Paenibacillus turpanensis]|uniref:hypothetical protein n=1 Tax=Paenibacillus turpanensis TaxID=2689078 RepID=UPI0014077422|nr:hypothetical protein [Paenibacillus turpanensis]
MKKKIIAAAAVLLVVGSATVLAHDTYRYKNEYYEPIAPREDYGKVKQIEGDFREQEISNSQAEVMWTEGKVTVKKPDGSTAQMDTDVAGFRVKSHTWNGSTYGPELEYHTFGD